MHTHSSMKVKPFVLLKDARMLLPIDQIIEFQDDYGGIRVKSWLIGLFYSSSLYPRHPGFHRDDGDVEGHSVHCARRGSILQISCPHRNFTKN